MAIWPKYKLIGILAILSIPIRIRWSLTFKVFVQLLKAFIQILSTYTTEKTVGDDNGPIGNSICEENSAGDPCLCPQNRADDNNRAKACEKAR